MGAGDNGGDTGGDRGEVGPFDFELAFSLFFSLLADDLLKVEFLGDSELEEGDSALAEERAVLESDSTLGEAGGRDSFLEASCLEESCLEESSEGGMALDEDEEVSIVEGSVSDDSPLEICSGGGTVSFVVRVEDEGRGERGDRGGAAFAGEGSISPAAVVRRISVADAAGEAGILSNEEIVGMGAVEAVLLEERIWPDEERLSPEGTGELPTQVNQMTSAVMLSVVPIRSARLTKFFATLCFTESFRT